MAAADAHRFDEPALAAYLRGRLPGFDAPIKVEKFAVGQSNPTYRIDTAVGPYVLRKKPAGKLLPSAHAVDREYRIMTALAASDVPVPKMHLLCEDESVIGQAFYVMQFVHGRVFMDATMPGETTAFRRAAYLDLARVLARMHRLDWKAVGLEGFGRPEKYVERQLARWSKQWFTSRVEDNADMDAVIAWLEKRVPSADETAISHGDYRTHNVMFHPTEPRIIAVLDWELATLGHPLADLGYCCLAYVMPKEDARGLRGADPVALGIPTMDEFTAAYGKEAGRSSLPDWPFFLVFSMFRNAAIRAGIYKRAKDGTASSADALQTGLGYRPTAASAMQLARAAGG